MKLSELNITDQELQCVIGEWEDTKVKAKELQLALESTDSSLAVIKSGHWIHFQNLSEINIYLDGYKDGIKSTEK